MMVNEDELAGPPVLIVTGTAAATQANVNRLVKEYVVTQWFFAVVKDEVHVTAIMLSQAEIRKAQLAQARMPHVRK